jgi:hypothetical protein
MRSIARALGCLDAPGCRTAGVRKERRDWQDSLTLSIEITDSNAAFVDAPNGLPDAIAGIHEVLRRQGLLAGQVSSGKVEEIDRVYRAYPHLNDDEFVRENLDRWFA